MLHISVDDFFHDPTDAPVWWKADGPREAVPRGAWGALQAHLAALRFAHEQDYLSVLIREGDAIPTGDCNIDGLCTVWLAEWPLADVLYLGGQYLAVEKITPRVVGQIGTHIVLAGGLPIRQHAYLATIRGVSRMIGLLESAIYEMHCNHVDFIFGRAIATGQLAAHGIAPWLYGQSSHRSAVTGRDKPAQEWQLSDADWRAIRASAQTGS